MKKRIPLIKAFARVFTVIFVTTVFASCSGKLSNKAITEGSAPTDAYHSRTENVAVAPGAIIGPQDASMGQGASVGMAYPAKAVPAVTISENDVKIKKDQAIEIANTMLDDPSAYVAGNAFLSPLYGIYGESGACWMIDFSETNSANVTVNVTIDANSGEITGFNRWDANEGQQVGKEPMTREDALVIAEKMLKDKFNINIGNYEIQKEVMSAYDLKMPMMGGPNVYSFTYTRIVNGVLFPYETVNITVDGVSGELRSFYHNVSQFDFSVLPSKDGAVSPEQALEQYRNAVNMSLQYITLYKDKPEAVLVYSPDNYLNMLDAFSGNPLNYDGTPYRIAPAISGQLVPMNPNAQMETKAITEKDAEALAERYRKLAENLYGVTLDNTGSNSNRYQQNGEDIWSGNWYKNDEKFSYGFYISINLKTGHIVNLSLSKYENGGIMPMEAGKGIAGTGIATPPEPNSNPVTNEGQKPEAAQSSAASGPAVIMPAPDYVQQPVNEKISWTEGKVKAITFLKDMLPETYGFYADSNPAQPAFSDEAMKYTREHNYVFVRVVNGIAYRDNNINVSVDRETGEIRNMYFSWSDLEFRNPDGVIGAGNAENKYFGDMEANLAYQLITSYDYNNGTVTDVKPVLVYNFSSKNGPYALNQSIDAFTGEFVGNNYMLMRDSVPSPYAK